MVCVPLSYKHNVVSLLLICHLLISSCSIPDGKQDELTQGDDGSSVISNAALDDIPAVAKRAAVDGENIELPLRVKSTQRAAGRSSIPASTSVFH